MARTRTLEDQLAGLDALRDDPSSESARRELARALAGKSNHVSGKAARIVGEADLRTLAGELVEAFGRFMDRPAQTDKGCAAKAAMAEALYRIGHDDEHLFLKGIRHEQFEPTWGGRVDTAAGLRGACAMGLVRMNYPRVMLELADLLADREPAARAAAAQALSYRGGDDAVPLLRFKLRTGDEQPEVVTECILALLQLDATTGLELAVQRLEAGDEQSEAAALALGQSRLVEAFEPLRERWERALDAQERRILLTAIAMLRREPALDFLVEQIRSSPEREACEVVSVLALYRHDATLVGRVREAAERRKDAALDRVVDETFDRRA